MNFKFGVIYAKKGQTSDDEMFGNSKSNPSNFILTFYMTLSLFFLLLFVFGKPSSDVKNMFRDEIFYHIYCLNILNLKSFSVKGSDEFVNFLNVLGDTIDLKGWTGYRGGLDVKGMFLCCFFLVIFGDICTLKSSVALQANCSQSSWM